ncbi:MAG TPA: hypothetical protein VFS67_30220 [Polyangiaceae bacterium]|nr:hypothetical protein [Polyangiaceae bacterium]
MFHRCVAIGTVAMVWVLCGAPAPALAQAQAPSASSAGNEERAPAAPPAPPEPEGTVSISALLGYGLVVGGGRGIAENYGFGAGVRAGYTRAATPWYLGGTLLGYRPESETEDVQLYALDFEVGYDISAGPVVVRPYLGLGASLAVFDLSERSEAGARAGSGISVRVVPGVLAMYPLGLLRVGAEARYARASSWRDELSLLGSAGVFF